MQSTVDRIVQLHFEDTLNGEMYFIFFSFPIQHEYKHEKNFGEAYIIELVHFWLFFFLM